MDQDIEGEGMNQDIRGKVWIKRGKVWINTLGGRYGSRH